jgi:hypothetical protein
MEEIIAHQLNYPFMSISNSCDRYEDAIQDLLSLALRLDPTVGTGHVITDNIVRQLREFSERRSHGALNGLAFVACQDHQIARLAGFIARCPRDVIWPRSDGRPVRVICMLLAPSGDIESYLSEFERAVRALRFPHATD